jgi:hypothetical protein
VAPVAVQVAVSVAAPVIVNMRLMRYPSYLPCWITRFHGIWLEVTIWLPPAYSPASATLSLYSSHINPQLSVTDFSEDEATIISIHRS